MGRSRQGQSAYLFSTKTEYKKGAVAASIQRLRSHSIRDRKKERRSKPHIIFIFQKSRRIRFSYARCSPPLSLFSIFHIPVKLIGIKSLSSLEHVINRTPEFLCNDAHGFCFSILLYKLIMPPLTTFIITEKENCSF